MKDLTKYLPKDGEMAEIEKKIWNDILKGQDYNIAKKAFGMLWKENPPCDNFGRLPDSRRFEDIYDNLAAQTVKQCSCCGGDTFLIFKHADGRELAHDCLCYLNAGLPPRTVKFSDFGLIECDSLDCPNPGKKEKITVSRGSWKYFKKLLSTCRYVKTITEEIDVPDEDNA